MQRQQRTRNTSDLFPCQLTSPVSDCGSTHGSSSPSCVRLLFIKHGISQIYMKQMNGHGFVQNWFQILPTGRGLAHSGMISISHSCKMSSDTQSGERRSVTVQADGVLIFKGSHISIRIESKPKPPSQTAIPWKKKFADVLDQIYHVTKITAGLRRHKITTDSSRHQTV